MSTVILDLPISKDEKGSCPFIHSYFPGHQPSVPPRTEATLLSLWIPAGIFFFPSLLSLNSHLCPMFFPASLHSFCTSLIITPSLLLSLPFPSPMLFQKCNLHFCYSPTHLTRYTILSLLTVNCEQIN